MTTLDKLIVKNSHKLVIVFIRTTEIVQVLISKLLSWTHISPRTITSTVHLSLHFFSLYYGFASLRYTPAPGIAFYMKQTLLEVNQANISLVVLAWAPSMYTLSKFCSACYQFCAMVYQLCRTFWDPSMYTLSKFCSASCQFCVMVYQL